MKSSITKLGALSKHSNKKKRQPQSCKMTLLRSSAEPLLTSAFLCYKAHPTLPIKGKGRAFPAVFFPDIALRLDARKTVCLP